MRHLLSKGENVRKSFYLAFFIVGGATLIIIGVAVINIAWAATVTIPAYGELKNRHVGESTKLYDRSGKVLLYDTVGAMRRTTVSLEDISPHLVNAAIAIEDASFYEHRGVRTGAIARAVLSNVANASFGQGGSTITQQLVKNTLLTKEKSFIRKIKEWVLALRLEKHYSKNEILETYFNEIPYGSTVYGAEEASLTYFNKPAKELSLSEASYLAALTKAPSYLSPWGPNREALTRQRDVVLDRMLALDMISETEFEDAKGEEVKFRDRNTASIRAPHFVFYVLEELKKKYDEEELTEIGLQVTTTLDWELQQESENIIKAAAPSNQKNFRASNAALVAIDPQSGQVLAMVGSRDYFNDDIDGQVNVALALRQPGSTFKPFAYATAFAKGYTPETVLFDLKTQFSTACGPANFSSQYPCYTPNNHDNDFRGPISMRDALAQSINVVGVKTLYLAGLEDTVKTAKSLGITTLTDPRRYGLSLVLGGGEVTLLEMTGAYGAFANDGEWHKPTPILAVHDKGGDILESYEKNPHQVLDREVVRTLNDILSDNTARTPTFGSNSPLYFKDTVVASKTGTTNNNRDAWVIGYTPSIVIGAWAGNNDNTPMTRRTSSFTLAPTWHTVMEKAIERFPSTAFQPPQKNMASASLPAPLLGKWDTASSTAGVHEILYWVDKNNPRSGAPANPYSDPQLALWEYPVAVWANERALAARASSTEFQSESLSGIGGPDGTGLHLTVSPVVTSGVNRIYTATIGYNGDGGIRHVSYYVNDIYIGGTSAVPFSLSFAIQPNGTSILRAVAQSSGGSEEAWIAITPNNVLTTSS
ncbi:MAG: transglycosylase domain-containing protein, partial [Parcubacteria group bacterium]